jgi:chromosomal replication initiator protein
MTQKIQSQQITSEDIDSNSANGPIIHPSLDQQWQHVCESLRKEIGENAYNNWIKPLMIKDLAESRLEIAAPTRFMADWIKTHYVDRIKNLWSANYDQVFSVDLTVVTPQGAATSPTLEKMALSGTEKTSATTPEAIIAGSNNLISQLDQRFTFENFVVGKPNELAHAAAKRVTESETVSFNPLFLYGGVGLGKTHLMHAIAHEIRSKTPDRRVLYMSAEKFMYQFVKAIRHKDTMSFKDQFRSVDVLMIDDLQFICGKDSTQEEFFHTFNALVDQNHQIIISADKSPSDLEGMEERLRSRLGWGLVADIHPTTYELRLGILEAKKDQLDQNMPQEVLEFLAHKITSNVRELEGALNRIAAHAELIGRPVTLENTQALLQDLLRANDRRVTIDDIQKTVCEHYNIRIADMHSARRSRNVARPRQVAMFLCKELTQYSLPEIGRKFGGRDHTTVMHGDRKIRELLETDKALMEDVEILKRALTL